MDAVFNSQALVNIARMLAQQSAIRLEIDPKATTFRATANRLTMPPLAVIAERFPQAADMEAYTVGAVYHESGHILHTDYELRKEFRNLYQGHEHYDLANALGQAIEDVVIERAQCDRFPGARPVLTKMWRLLYGKYGVHDAEKMVPLKKVSSFLFHASRHSVLGQDFTGHFAQVYRQALEADFSPALLSELDGQVRRLDFATSTKDGFEIAVSTLALMGIHPVQRDADQSQSSQSHSEPGAQAQGNGQAVQSDGQDLPSEQESQQPDDPQKGHAGDGETADFSDAQGDSASQDATPGATDSTDQADASDQQGAGQSTQPETQAQSDEDEGQDGAAETDGVEPEQTSSESPMNAAGEGEDSESGNDDVTVMVAKAMAELADSLPEPPKMAMYFGSLAGSGLAHENKVRSDPTAGMQLRDEIAQQTMYAAERLGTLLKAQTESRTEFSKKGQLMAARVWKLKAGNLRIFRNTVEGVEYSTAIKVLLDRSGSMASGMQTAVRAAAFLPLTFESIEGLHCSLDIFPGVRNAMERIKSFDERTQACLDRMAGICATGGTPLVEAMQLSSRDLLDFHADRKILVVITDGEPYDKAAARKMVKGLQAEGVEVIGIGIGGETRGSMKVIFDDYCVIRNVHELTDQLAHTMEVKLVERQNVA